jgi:MFS family permease
MLTFLPLLSIIIPTQLTDMDPDSKVTWLGIIAGVGVLTGLVTSPIVGALSDRTTSRFGRRRPWLIGGAVLTSIGYVLMMNAGSQMLLFLSYLFTGVSLSLITAVTAAILPDQVPPEQRGTVSGMVGIAMPLAIIIGSVMCGNVLKTTISRYVFVAVTVFAVVVLFALLFKDKPLPKGVVPKFKFVDIFKAFVFNPRKAPDFGWVWLARAVMFFGYSLVGNYLLYYLQDVIHYERLFPGHTAAEGVATLQIYNTVLMVIATVVGGILSDKLRRRRLFVVIASVIMAVSLAVIGLVPVWIALVVANTAFGFGMGAYMAVDTALVTQCLPKQEDRGKDMGILNIANNVPQALAPMVAVPVINLTHSYGFLYCAGGVMILASIIFIGKIKGVR